MRILAYAMDYWSGGQIKAIFLEHEVIILTTLSSHSNSLFFSGLFRRCWLFKKVYNGR